MEVFVILRETGEYSDRDVQAVRCVLTEDQARAAVERAVIEARSMRHLKPPYPHRESTHGHQMPDGSWVSDDISWFSVPRGAVFRQKPDADEIERRNEQRCAEYKRQCLAMGCVDPLGPQDDACYHYQAVSLWDGGPIIASVSDRSPQGEDREAG